MKATRENILQYASEQYGTQGERLWEKYPEHLVLRHPGGKWYGVVMNISRSSLGMRGEGKIDVLVMKCTPNEREELLTKSGFLPAYHMNKMSWITAILGKADYSLVCKALDEAYLLAPKTKKKVRQEAKCFILPVNVKIHDVREDFAANEEVEWTQKRALITGDRLYLYLTAPVSGVMYCCDVISAQPAVEGGGTRVKAKLVRTYSPPAPLSLLKEHGIYYLRGMQSVPYGLQYELENNY